MKKFLSLVLALVMTMSLVTVSAGAKDFTDDSKINYKEAVDVLSAAKVIDGYADGAFNPANTLTRGAAAKIICNLILGPTTASALVADAAPYKDVPTSNNFAGYIAYCQKEGIISGYADGTFRPAGTLTGYAFMKMLLGALGYDATIEQYTGNNWSINVAKRALNIGLDDDLIGDFNGVKAVNREEACLYAFNTLKATMVDYDSTTNITVGGTQIVVGGSKAEEVTNKLQAVGKETIKEDGLLQFAEKYFDKLVSSDRRDDTKAEDEFMRPATQWTYDKEDVGTYAKTPDATYTAETESGDIYKDLGLSKTTSYAVFEDGVKASPATFTLSKGDEDAKIGANGVLVEVYEDDARVVLINTYVADVTDVEEATAKKDAYITLSLKGDTYTNILSAEDTFETEGFDEDDVVLFTYSLKKAGSSVEGVQSVVKAQSVSGEVTKYTSTKNLTIDGTTYKYSAKKGSTVSQVNVDRVVYLDQYGYAIYADDAAVSVAKLAYVLKAGKDSNRGGSDKWAKLLYTNGTVETVTTSKVYGTDGTSSDPADTNLVGKFVSYKTNASGQVVLTAANYAKNLNNTISAPATSTKVLEKGKSSMTKLGLSGIGSANSDTLFLLYSKDDDEAKVYTGIKNVPDVTQKASCAMVVAGLSKNNKAAAIILVYTDDAITSNSSADYLFLRGADVKFTEDDDDTYYVFDAVKNGEITEVKLESNSDNASYISTLVGKTNVLVTDYSVDGELYTINDADDQAPDGNHDGALQAATSITKASGDVVTVNGTGYTLADGVKVYKVSSSGKLSVSSLSTLRDAASIGNTGDYFEQVSVAYNDNDEITAIYVELK